VLTIFGGRLVQMQGMQSGAYRKLAAEERVIKHVLTGVRGTIYDATGQPLAMTLETFTVTADPAQMAAKDKPKYAAELARPLGMPQQQVLSLLEHPTRFGGGSAWIVLSPKAGLPPPASAAITALDVPGIVAVPSYPRLYPDGPATANVVGFATDPSGKGVLAGKSGIEEQYNRLLAGRNGSEEGYWNADRRQAIPLEGATVTPATDGGDIKLTINSALQLEAQQACEAQVAKVHARDCTVVVMQPKTGDILAMAQWPPYYQPGASQPQYTWQDLPAQAMFEPGSTAKVITAAAALEHGGQTPMSAYYIPSAIYEGGQWIRDAENDGGSHYTIAGIIANSSNVGMAQVANTITPQVQYQYLRNFGLGQPTGLNLPGEIPGVLPKPSTWAADERYTLSYGQGVDVTALQMASVYATLANGGVRVQPRLIAGTTTASGTYTPAPPAPSRRVIQASTAKELIQILQQVPGVDEKGGEPWGIIPGYAIAAKTGTSSETGPECTANDPLCEYGSSYIGIAPGDNPQVVVAVNVQDPNKTFGYFGDVVAGPVFYQVMKSALQTLQIPPDGATVPNVRLTAP
jgi:cell division protein FtsI (penicillin-binding protein 3)